uniref:C-type lectin domain-containing protein n=1 Tax=Ditylenchus dipsaci TaxID=166011 RepID=A0A915EX63_9BILA
MHFGCAFTTFLYLASIAVVESLVCPYQWSFFKGNCWFVSLDAANWSEADWQCSNRYGASLATVQSLTDDRLIAHLVLKDEVDKAEEHNHLFNKFFFDALGSRLEDCFKKEENVVLLNSSLMSPANISSASNCMEECLRSQPNYGFFCKSILWVADSLECVLNEQAYESNSTFPNLPKTDTASHKIVYYSNKCTELMEHHYLKDAVKKPKDDKRRKEIAGVRSCFTKHRHSSLVGFADQVVVNITERECLDHCFRCTTCLTGSDQSCKSATYYPAQSQCILAAASKKANLEFFDQSEVLADFFERRRDCQPGSCEDQEIGLIFAIDGSNKMGRLGFEESMKLIYNILEGVQEITEFWWMCVIQLGTEGPAVIEIPLKEYFSLEEARKALKTLTWRGATTKSRLGESLVDSLEVVRQVLESSQLNSVWMLVLTNGWIDEDSDDIQVFVQARKQENFNVISISPISPEEPNYPILQQIASSTDHLIHWQRDKHQLLDQLNHLLCTHSKPIFSSLKEDMILQANAKSLFHSPKQHASDIVQSKMHEQLDQAYKIPKNGSIYWLGLRRNDLGQMEWKDGSVKQEFDQQILDILEAGKDEGDCIGWSSRHWAQRDCGKRHKFVCRITPRMNINQKLESMFDGQLSNKSNESQITASQENIDRTNKLVPL